MKAFKIFLSIVLGVGILVGIMYIVSLNHKVQNLESLYSELKTRLPENNESSTDDNETPTPSIATSTADNDDPKSDWADTIKTPRANSSQEEVSLPEKEKTDFDNDTKTNNSSQKDRLNALDDMIKEVKLIYYNSRSDQVADRTREFVNKNIHKLDKRSRFWFEKNILNANNKTVVTNVQRIAHGWDPFSQKKEI